MQTTRGTPLSRWRGDTPRTGGKAGVLLVLLLAAVLVLVDQVSKAVALETLLGREPVELLGGFLTLRLVRNPGAAFGIATGFTVVLTVAALVVTVVIVRVARRLSSLPWAIALGLLLGGAVGNLIDRLFRPPAPFRGHVIDFLQLPFTLVFNVADAAITFAGIGMIVLSFRGVPIGDEPVAAAAVGPAEPAADSPDEQAVRPPDTGERHD